MPKKNDDVPPIITSPEKDMQHIMARHWQRNLVLSIPLVLSFVFLAARLYQMLTYEQMPGEMLSPARYNIIIALIGFILVYATVLLFYLKRKKS